MTISFETKFQKGDKIFVIRQRPEQRYILEVKEVTITGLGYQMPVNQAPMVMYFFKQNVEDEKEREQFIGEPYAFASVKEAEKGLIEAGADIRAEYDVRIAECKKQMAQLKHEQENIARVLPNEVAYIPKVSINEEEKPTS